jgi:two-component system CheB/CheR fusion protein
MGLRHIEDMGDYVELLRQNKDEVAALYKDLLISVTNFFREPEAWETLARKVVAPLVRKHPSELPLRVWVPGCATGEEAYSLALLLTERFQATDKACPLQVFASDIDQDALAIARAGIYPESIAADVSPQRLRRFFVKGEHTFRINKEIREAVVFAEQNLISDPPFSKLDLVSCRNLMIYLEADLQKRILGMFHFALNEGGCLLLGGSETVGQQHDLFEPISRKHRIYRRIGPTRLNRVELPVAALHAARQRAEGPAGAAPQPGRHLQVLAQQLMLQRFAPACVLIDRKSQVLYASGPVDRYLQLPPGEPAVDLLAMARPGLRTKLRAAIQQATQNDRSVSIVGAHVRRDEGQCLVRVSVEPLRQPREAEGLLLVSFDEESADERARLQRVEREAMTAAEEPTGDREREAIHHLEDELRLARDELQSTLEELETSNEEFKASNEEVVSVNEELQSTNEELETSQEELRSLNEELQTINSQ